MCVLYSVWVNLGFGGGNVVLSRLDMGFCVCVVVCMYVFMYVRMYVCVRFIL